MDVEAVLRLAIPIGSGNISRKSRGYFDASVVEEAVVDHEVVVAYCGYGTHDKLDILCYTGVWCGW